MGVGVAGVAVGVAVGVAEAACAARNTIKARITPRLSDNGACDEVHAESPLEKAAFLPQRPQLEVQRLARGQGHVSALAAERHADPLDEPAVRAVERVGDPQERRELLDDGLLPGVERPKGLVRVERRRLAVVPGHEGDQLHLGLREALQVAVQDQVVRVVVVARVGDRQADVVQHGGMLEPLALERGELMKAVGLVEEREREVPNAAGVRPRSSAAIAATARIVPDVPTAVLTFARRTGLRRRSRRLLTARRRRRSSFAERGSDETKRSVRRTAPRSRLSARRIRSPFATTTSVDPPPMSRTRSGSHEGGSSERTARVMSRASSSPEITARRSPVSLRTRLTNSSPFAASRTAHVATAVIAPAPAARASAA